MLLRFAVMVFFSQRWCVICCDGRARLCVVRMVPHVSVVVPVVPSGLSAVHL